MDYEEDTPIECPEFSISLRVITEAQFKKIVSEMGIDEKSIPILMPILEPQKRQRLNHN